MTFTHNKDQTLRSMIGNDKFAKLINKTVDLIGSLDKINCIALLDKSKQPKKVLEIMISHLLDRLVPTYFCST